MTTLARGLAAVLLLAGCSPSSPGPSDDAGPLHPVTGLVRKGGSPAVGARVRLNLLNRVRDPSAPVPSGVTGPDGRFKLALPDGREGAPAGQYHISLVWPTAPGGPDRLAGAYEEPEGSGLVADITGPIDLPPIDLQDRPAGAE